MAAKRVRIDPAFRDGGNNAVRQDADDKDNSDEQADLTDDPPMPCVKRRPNDREQNARRRSAHEHIGAADHDSHKAFDDEGRPIVGIRLRLMVGA